MELFAVFVWRQDGRYHAQDAIGSRVYRSLRQAERRAEKLNACPIASKVAPSGYVVRRNYHTTGVSINAASGRVSMLTTA